MHIDSFLSQRLICVAVIDQADDAVPLAEALLAGGLKVMEVTFRTASAAESIRRIRQNVPQVLIGAGTLLTADNVKQAVDAGAQFGVSPGLSEAVWPPHTRASGRCFRASSRPRKSCGHWISAGNI